MITRARYLTLAQAFSAGLLVVQLAACVCSPVSALTLAGLAAPSVPIAANTPCPQHPGYSSYSTALPAGLLPAGRNFDFESAWGVALPEGWNPALWTLQWSTTPLDAVLNITTHRAVNYTPDDPLYNPAYYAGVEINIDWTPTAAQQNLKWIQAIHTNRPRYTFERYLDILPLRPPADQPPAYPYSYSDYHFYDKPRRVCEPDQHIFWSAYLYLADIDRVGRTVTIYEGVHWGYTLDCVPVPELPGVVVLIAGVGPVLVLLRARRRP